MNVKRLRILGLEIFKILQIMNLVFMENLFHRTRWLTKRAHNIRVNTPKAAKYGHKRLRTQCEIKVKFQWAVL